MRLFQESSGWLQISRQSPIDHLVATRQVDRLTIAEKRRGQHSNPETKFSD